MVRFSAFMVPPPVVIMPPELSLLVVMVESEMLTVVPSEDELLVVAEPPYENTPLAPVALVVMFAFLIVRLAPFLAIIAELVP